MDAKGTVKGDVLESYTFMYDGDEPPHRTQKVLQFQTGLGSGGALMLSYRS